ncbi:MAG: radical SAM protein [Deltaproteobacteria bacterium]|nr:MAG: radical SAM protein [Deltaproteobacteria bacterium]UCH06967.1 MAG: radical SAM protein [Deltaproteobacteria bacterium]
MRVLDNRKLYRIPWSLYDNPLGWIEVTDECDMECKGCYRNYIETREGHKSLEDIKKEALFMQKERNVSEISLAGGEPLLHPEIIDIVKFISMQKLGVKIFTNGKSLTHELMHELVLAGLNHISFHVDSGQTRNNEWGNKSEAELDGLRQYYVNMCQNERGLTLSFTFMVTKKNLKDIPRMTQWALDNRGKVGGLTFIAVRCCKTVESERKHELVSIDSEDNVTSVEIYDLLKRHYPNYGVAAYFGGTVDPRSFKWLFSVSVCSSNILLGSIGPISMELYQMLKHLMYGRYLMNDKDEGLIARCVINLICLLFDRNIHRAVLGLVKRPRLLLDALYSLRIIIIQGHDISLFGDMDMCDGCPDMTYFQGRLVNSCRLDEFRRYGRFITDLRKEQ